MFLKCALTRHAAVVCLVVFALFLHGSHALEISTSRMAREVVSNVGRTQYILVYDSLDITCQRARTTFNEVVDLRSSAHVHLLDARNRDVAWLVNSLNIKVLPTMRVLHPRKGRGRHIEIVETLSFQPKDIKRLIGQDA